MAAAALAASSFDRYPPQAHALALQHLALLQALPPVLAAVLLKEVIAFDWKFPAERTELERQLTLLGSLPEAERTSRVARFAAIRLSPQLAQTSFVAAPGPFMESLTAWLWSSGQMEAFRGAAEEYASYLNKSLPTPRPQTRRLGIVVVGAEVPAADAAVAGKTLFRKLRPHGLTLSNVNPRDGLATLLAAIGSRSRTSPSGYRHWYLDGGEGLPVAGPSQIAYAQLQRPLDLLLRRIQQEMDSGAMGPERLRTTIAQMRPEEIGLGTPGADPILDRFKLALLTEGAGTQIFATTFLQWAARECLRRAQPETILLRYAPRRQVASMNTMLSNAQVTALDPLGSLVDADMGAFYTWLNMNRLSGADEMSFLAWFEGQKHAMAIGPGLPRGTASDSPLSMEKVLHLLA